MKDKNAVNQQSYILFDTPCPICSKNNSFFSVKLFTWMLKTLHWLAVKHVGSILGQMYITSTCKLAFCCHILTFSEHTQTRVQKYNHKLN